jgi:hypothetical protein
MTTQIPKIKSEEESLVEVFKIEKDSALGKLLYNNFEAQREFESLLLRTVNYERRKSEERAKGFVEALEIIESELLKLKEN